MDRYDSEQYVGNFSFNGSEAGDAYADFLLGYSICCHSERIRLITSVASRRYYQFFAQDDIRLSEHLTVNVGLRYEYSPWLNGYKGQLGTFDPSKIEAIIVQGRTDQVDLTSQFPHRRPISSFGKYIQTSSQAGCHTPSRVPTGSSSGQELDLRGARSAKRRSSEGGYGIFYEPEGSGGRVNLNILPFRLNETVNQIQNVAQLAHCKLLP